MAVHILLLYLKMGELYGLLEEETMVCKKLFVDNFVFFSLSFKIFIFQLYKPIVENSNTDEQMFFLTLKKFK